MLFWFFDVRFDEILNSYGINSYDIERVRSAYRISSDKNKFLVKKFNSERKLINTSKILNYLNENGFKYVNHICKNKNGKFYFEIDGKFYGFFNWIDGREANLKNSEEILKCTRIIYKFHDCVKNLNYNDMDLKDNSNWIEKLKLDVKNLCDIEKIILRKFNIDKLDKFYLLNVKRAIHKIINIINFLEENDFLKYSINNKIVCHDSLYYQNFIMKNNKVYIIDFGGICINNCIYDLAKFARRVFYKNKFDLSILNKMYNLYNRFYRFSDFEKIIFCKYLDYPYKFVRLSCKFYLKDKNLKSDKLFCKFVKYVDYELNFKKRYDFV